MQAAPAGFVPKEWVQTCITRARLEILSTWFRADHVRMGDDVLVDPWMVDGRWRGLQVNVRHVACTAHCRHYRLLSGRDYWGWELEVNLIPEE